MIKAQFRILIALNSDTSELSFYFLCQYVA